MNVGQAFLPVPLIKKRTDRNVCPTIANLDSSSALDTFMKDKKQLKREYQQTPRPMGVFVIRNNLNDKVFVGSSLNLPGIINRHRFALERGLHANRRLQADWNEFGSDNFAFEIVDELSPGTDPQADHRKELAFLEDLWLERLQPYGERGYNEPKISREERLRRIAAKNQP